MKHGYQICLDYTKAIEHERCHSLLRGKRNFGFEACSVFIGKFGIDMRPQC